ncbi:hypothetical protein [Intestinibacillus massiliensis]|uniref:hypothetical protein n=1 Tax=Intestinibacillus massiliensis TaxID=1871029 RepID=UPI000B362532|nr:hypothetical protein [Intestinibacillus massiliensis]
MTRTEARDYFSEKGLTYASITIKDLNYLELLLNEQFLKQQKERLRTRDKPVYWLRVNTAKYYKGEYTEAGGMVCAYMTGKGRYFNSREIISFNRDGFIGFCGDADEQNSVPVLTAFCDWCDWLTQPAQEEV